jgi:hypothetical protein
MISMIGGAGNVRFFVLFVQVFGQGADLGSEAACAKIAGKTTAREALRARGVALSADESHILTSGCPI